MEKQSELDFEQVLNQGPLPIQETFAPTKHASNMLSTSTESIQLVELKPIEPTQTKICLYIYLKHH